MNDTDGRPAMHTQRTRPELFSPPETCPSCGTPSLCPVLPLGGEVNFRCGICGACWHYELGWLRHVASSACPGCDYLPQCTSTARS